MSRFLLSHRHEPRKRGAPVLTMHLPAGLESLPKGVATVATIDRLQQAFPGEAQPATVAVEADVDASATTAAIAELRRQALTSGQVGRPIDLEVNRGHTLARVTVARR